MSEQCTTKDQLATPTVAGQYSSTCLSCKRPMEWTDKRCRICTDCDKPQEQHPSTDPLVDELRGVCRLLPLEIAGRAADEIERLQRELDQANRNLAMAIGAAQPGDQS